MTGGCPDGHHVMKRPLSIDRRGTICAQCGVGDQSLYSPPNGAARGDYRVVCREDGCEYGPRVDADGHGYSNHVHIVLALAALHDHQDAASDAPHAAQIEQHPREEVVRHAE